MRDQEIIGLWEAYQQVHAQPQEEVELDEGRTTSLQALSRESAKRKADKERGRPETESEVHGRLMMGNFRPGASPKERAAGGRQRLKDRGKVPQKDGKDMFEHILEYLVTEGYAATNKEALVIMANMSEEWKQSIVEEVGILRRIFDPKHSAAYKHLNPPQPVILSPGSGPMPPGLPDSPFEKRPRPRGPVGLNVPGYPASYGDDGRLTPFGARGGAAAEKQRQAAAAANQRLNVPGYPASYGDDGRLTPFGARGGAAAQRREKPGPSNNFGRGF